MMKDAMATRLITFYKTDEVQKKSKTKVKIIVDSLIEQLCNYYFKTYPSGIANVRQMINKELINFGDTDETILRELNKVLRSYDEAFSKKYSDQTEVYDKFVNGAVVDLILALMDGGLFRNSTLIDELKGLLHERKAN